MATPTIFDSLRYFDIAMNMDQQQCPWFIVYDVDAILSSATDNQSTSRLK